VIVLGSDFECGRCEEPLSEKNTVFKPARNQQGRSPMHPGCYVASRLLQNTRGPIYNNPEEAIQPARVWSRVLARIQYGEHDELFGDKLRKWLPDHLDEMLSNVEAALNGNGPVGVDVEDQEEKETQDSLNSFNDEDEADIGG